MKWLESHWQITGGILVTVLVAWYFSRQASNTSSATDPNQAALDQQLADENAASQASALSTLFGGGASNGSSDNNPNSGVNTQSNSPVSSGGSTGFPTIVLLPIPPSESGTLPSGTNTGSGNPSSSTIVTPPGAPATLPFGTPPQIAGNIPIATSPSANVGPSSYHGVSPSNPIISPVLIKAPSINPIRTKAGATTQPGATS